MAVPTGAQANRLKWWQEARFGMFIHWGIYSATKNDCWTMYDQGIPAAQYAERFEPKFTGKKFDADELMATAKQAGFKYVVMGSKHHEGYCLWDTATTDFNSAKMTPKRDFIAEYTAAARKAELKVGLYYSPMDWRWPGFWKGPKKDLKAWNEFVDVIHAQVKELVTRYGRIDVLWYDGAAPPQWSYWGFVPTDIKGSKSKQMRKYWRADKLNSFVRRHQPHILMNNRMFSDGDFKTPEQEFRPTDTPWELCDTMGDLWGYSPTDLNRRSAGNLLLYLIKCVQSGGNLLLNVGPRADGTLPAWQRRNLEGIGKWLDTHGEAIYGCDAVNVGPLRSALAPWMTTSKGQYIYMHLARYPGESFSVANIHGYRFVSAKMLDTGEKVKITHRPTCDVFSGLPAKSPDDICSVLKVKVKPDGSGRGKKEAGISLDTNADCR